MDAAPESDHGWTSCHASGPLDPNLFREIAAMLDRTLRVRPQRPNGQQQQRLIKPIQLVQNKSRIRPMVARRLRTILSGATLILQVLGPLAASAQSTSPTNTNIAGPSATATGAVTNQAVQVLQGPYAVNTYGGGTSCQSATFNVQGFAYGNQNFSEDPTAYSTRVINPGMTIGISVPIDSTLQKLCKERALVEIQRAQAETDKARLDYELVRMLRCGEAKKQGIYLKPDSPYAQICADVLVGSPSPRASMR